MEYVGSRIAHRVMLVAAVISSGIRLMWPALRTRYALRARISARISHILHISHATQRQQVELLQPDHRGYSLDCFSTPPVQADRIGYSCNSQRSAA